MALFVMLAVPAPPALGEDPAPPAVDTSRWACTLCPYRYGWHGEIDFGGGWVSEASNQFGDYRGLNDDGAFVALDGEVNFRDKEGKFLDVQTDDLGIDSRRLEARGGTRGRYTIELGYQEIPKYRGHGAETPYRGVGSDTLSLPAGWQDAPQTSGMESLPGALHSIDLETTRKTVDLGLRWKNGTRWTYEVDYQHQAKDGTRPFGAGVFTINASHLPAPVDFSTDRIEAGLNFNGKRAHWRLGFTGSSFDNAAESVTWENPFTAQPGTEALRASLAPDNSFYQFDMAGAWSPAPRLRLSANAAIGRMEQNDPLLPYSINPEFADRALPRMTADAEIDVANLNLSGKLSARLARGLDFTARVRRDERDNQTPVDLWTPIITDFLEREARPNRPYSFTRDRAEATLRYRPASALRLRAGGQWETYERTLQSIMETREGGWFAEAAYSPGEMIELRARLEQSDRDADPYVPVEDYALPEHPLMRKFNLADRKREHIRIDVDLFPAPDLLVNLAYRRGEDDYEASIIGLRESDNTSLSLDVSWAPSAVITAYAFVSHETFDALQASSPAEGIAPWLAETKDRFLTGGAGLTWTPGRDISVGFDLVHAEADGDILVDGAAGEPPFPTLVTDLFNARARLEYRATERWGVKVYLEHERYDSSDWALDGYAPDSIPAVLTFGADSPDYDVTLVRVQASYRF